ncbi:HEAT repeat domain-containing protein [Actinocorallia longicatena]|uniref:HEAT repeat protein n=1 Tax=Actinocorallia longicatena TaxID=111803 RepID=A0ABP6PZE5_9ACTN
MNDFHMIEEYLRDPDPRVRRAAVALLAETGPRGTGDALAWALADEDPDVRATAAEGLGATDAYVSDDGIAALVLAAAKGADATVRATAAALLAALAAAAREQYAQGLADGEPQVRAHAVLSLIALRAVEQVREAADDPSRDVRVAVADGLAKLGTADGLDQLLSDHDPVVRLAALDAAQILGLPTPLTGRVIASLAHPSWQVRKRTAAVLALATPEDALNPLIRALRDPTVDVRRAAVRALEQWAAHHPSALSALTEALADPDPGVRTQVRWALA